MSGIYGLDKGRLPSNFSKFITQKCLGYNEDYSKSIFANVIELVDGCQETIYSWHNTIK